MTKEVAKAGWQLDKAIEECCLRTWASFKAEWVTDKQKPNLQTFAERDAAAGRKRWEEMTGRKWPENETWIDAETFTLGIEHDTTD
jgi:hypothetical protein